MGTHTARQKTKSVSAEARVPVEIRSPTSRGFNHGPAYSLLFCVAAGALVPTSGPAGGKRRGVVDELIRDLETPAETRASNAHLHRPRRAASRAPAAPPRRSAAR